MKIGDKYPVWWFTGEKGCDGRNVAEVLKVMPYTGAYP